MHATLPLTHVIHGVERLPTVFALDLVHGKKGLAFLPSSLMYSGTPKTCKVNRGEEEDQEESLLVSKDHPLGSWLEVKSDD